jgi:capsular polysaccharide biosynthesis protein
VFDPSVESVDSLVAQASGAKLLIGLTGSSMIAALFMPKRSAVVELFPFGLGPDVSSFIQVNVSFA